MTQEEKKLLLKDLCARLPYGVKCYNMFSEEICELAAIELDSESPLFCFWDKRKMFYHQQTYISEFKPYLFPMSSMTEEQKRELRQMDAFINTFGNVCFAVYDEYGHDIIPTYEDAIRITNWLNKNHYDYRGLIEKGLAIDATGLNIY